MNIDKDSVISFTPIPAGTSAFAKYPNGETWQFPVLGYAVIVNGVLDDGSTVTRIEPVVYSDEEGIVPIGVESHNWRLGVLPLPRKISE